MQKDEGCYWFGEPGRCGTYNAIEAIICFCAVLDLLVGIFQDLVLTIYGENRKRCVPSTLPSWLCSGTCSSVPRSQLSTACRLLLTLLGLSMLCELAVISVTVLNLFSERKHPLRDTEKHAEQLSVMLVSIATTVFGFFLSIFGAGSALAGAKEVANKFRQASEQLNGHGSLHVAAVMDIFIPEVSEMDRVEHVV